MLTQRDLDQFTGTENHYRHYTNYKYTDGVKYMAEKAGAYWLINEIFIITVYNKNLQRDFVAWKLKKTKDTAAILSCEDGNYNKLFSKKIDFTDFPLDSIDLWFEDGVLILPSEH